MESEKRFFPLPLFEPEKGEAILSPEAAGAGYWVGAPTVVYDSSRESFLLCYRRRRPRGRHPDRGYFAAVAESRDGRRFEDIWTLGKEELDSTSIEKCCVLRCPDGRYRYYLSYVDPDDLRWRTDVVEADAPDGFDISQRREVFTAATASGCQEAPVEGVKDPNVYVVGGVYYMYLSFAEGGSGKAASRDGMHDTGDVYNTGLLTAPSALATSVDGVRFHWQGRCLGVGARGNWDAYQARMNSVLRHDGIWYGFYDSCRGVEENYEERCGLAQSFDLRRWEKISRNGPLITVPWASGSVRYTEALRVRDEIYYYYEMAREDGSHELRCSVVPAG